MNNPRLSNFTQRVESQGFSLLELAVVVAVLGMLSSIAIPSILGIGKDSNVSEAKSLLNSAAVDCLQSIRNGKSEVDTPPDPTPRPQRARVTRRRRQGVRGIAQIQAPGETRRVDRARRGTMRRSLGVQARRSHAFGPSGGGRH